MNDFSAIWADLLPVTHYLELRTDNILRAAPLSISTPAFAWLAANAGAHGFHMSYPRDNPHGIVYEPWHWRFDGPPANAA